MRIPNTWYYVFFCLPIWLCSLALKTLWGSPCIACNFMARCVCVHAHTHKYALRHLQVLALPPPPVLLCISMRLANRWAVPYSQLPIQWDSYTTIPVSHMSTLRVCVFRTSIRRAPWNVVMTVLLYIPLCSWKCCFLCSLCCVLCVGGGSVTSERCARISTASFPV